MILCLFTLKYYVFFFFHLYRLKMSNSYINKVYNKQNIALERIKLRKEYELKNDEQERPKM